MATRPRRGRRPQGPRSPMIERGVSCGYGFLMVVGEPRGDDRSQRSARWARLSPAPLSPRPRPQKVTKWEIHARIGYQALRIAHSTRRKAQGRLRTSDSRSRCHQLGPEVRLPAQSVAEGQASGGGGVSGPSATAALINQAPSVARRRRCSIIASTPAMSERALPPMAGSISGTAEGVAVPMVNTPLLLGL